MSPSVTLDFREALETVTVDTSCSLKGFHELIAKFVMYERFFKGLLQASNTLMRIMMMMMTSL